MLASLRPLGLRGMLDWSGLVEAAASIDSSRGAGGKGTAGAGPSRGRALLTYMDTHEARLFDLKKEPTGFLQRMSQFVYQDPAAEKRVKERLAALSTLMSLSWVSLVLLP